MITLFRANHTYSLNELTTKIKEHIERLARTIAPTGTPLNILRYEFPIEPIDLFAWLHNQKQDRKLYWADRNTKHICAGIGVADTVTSETAEGINGLFEHIEDRLADDNHNLKFFGGMRFDLERSSEEWAAYPAYEFIVPRFEICQDNGEYKFALNIAAKDITEEQIKLITDDFARIDFSPETRYRGAPNVEGRVDLPTREHWEQQFSTAKDLLEAQRLKKIVLARRSDFRFDKAIDPVALTKHLADITPSSFHFCFQIKPFEGFIGATPERLFKLCDGQIKTEALAGTSQRSSDPENDKLFAQKLIDSQKNADEHQYVVEHITKALSGKTKNLEAEQRPVLLTLPKAHHLITHFTANATTQTSPQSLLESLHPTPAVAGTPAKEAVRAIAEIEPFDRGYYCGPVGYVGKNTCEFAVAIRSGLIRREILSLYAGAGIVKDSECSEEWEEIETKISNFIKVFDQ